MTNVRDVILEHDCRYTKTGELFDGGDVVIYTSDQCEPGYFEGAWQDLKEVHGGPLTIPNEEPASFPGYEGEVEDFITNEWVDVVFCKTFIRTSKTDEELVQMLPIIEAKARLLGTY